MKPENNIPAFPVECSWTDGEPHGVQTGNTQGWAIGLTIRDYAAIKFTAVWMHVLANTTMVERREDRIAEANRLGLLQADNFIEARK